MSGEVLCFSHLRWGFVFQRPNHLMSRYARERRVFFIEEPIFESSPPHLTTQHVESGVVVVVPRLPLGTVAEDVAPLQTGLLDAFLVEQRVRDPIVWFYTPMALDVARHVRREVTVYDCMDELSGFRDAPQLLGERERELFQLADLVFTGGESLYHAKRRHHPSVHAFPSSVDAAHFAKARAPSLAEEPPDQRAIPHPRLGFFGVVDERMDVELLRDAAELRQDLQFVVLGPVAKIDPGALPRAQNIHFLGQKSYAELPAYIAGWDVAIMPFALNEATRYISPTKTLEYLAAGKPVVSTAVPDVVRPYGEEGLVRIAGNARELVEAAQAALDERDTPAGDQRRASCDDFVARTSWDRTWARMHALVREVAKGPTRGEKEETPCSTISS